MQWGGFSIVATGSNLLQNQKRIICTVSSRKNRCCRKSSIIAREGVVHSCDLLQELQAGWKRPVRQKQ